jgi:hypothetical protein
MPDSPEMRELKLAAAAYRRADERQRAAILAAVDAKENQSDIARIVGRSREYVRLVKRESEGRA